MLRISAIVIGICGAVILISGVFIPIAKVPFAGDKTLFDQSNSEALILIFLAIASIMLILIKKTSWLIATGFSSLIVLGYRYFLFKSELQEYQDNLSNMIPGIDLSSFAGHLSDSIEIYSSTVIVLSLGAVLISLSAALRLSVNRSRYYE
jgi:hypothetical protein